MSDGIVTHGTTGPRLRRVAKRHCCGYRIECIFGFVVGMVFTFGTVLPALVAVVFAAVSVVVHFVLRAILSAIRSPDGQVPSDSSFKQTRRHALSKSSIGFNYEMQYFGGAQRA